MRDFLPPVVDASGALNLQRRPGFKDSSIWLWAVESAQHKITPEQAKLLVKLLLSDESYLFSVSGSERREECAGGVAQHGLDRALFSEIFQNIGMKLFPLVAFSPSHLALYFETWARVNLPLQVILDSSQEVVSVLDNFDSAGFQTDAVLAERMYLRGFALNRTSERAEAVRCFAAAMALAGTSAQKVSLQVRVELEKLVDLLNKDFDLEVASSVEALFAEEDKSAQVDTITAIRLLAVFGLATGELGDFSAQSSAMQLESDLLACFDNESLLLTQARRQAVAMFRQEKFTQAQELVNGGIARTRNLLPVQALFLNIKAEILLQKNDLLASEEVLSELSLLIEQGAIPKDSTAYNDLKLELALRKRSVSLVREQLGVKKKLGLKEQSRESLRSLIVASRVELLEGNADAAYETICKAIEMAQAGCQRPALLDCHFHAAGICFANRNSINLRHHLEFARDLARSLGLKVSETCFEFVIARLREPRSDPSLRPLLNLMKNGVKAPEIVYLTSFYGFGTDFSREIECDGKVCIVSDHQLWGWLTRDGLFWVPSEGLLFLREGSAFRVADVLGAKSLVSVISLFLSQNNKISVPEVHSLSSTAPYNPIRHESQARSLVTRMRKCFADLGLSVSRKADLGVFEYDNTQAMKLPVYWIRKYDVSQGIPVK